MTIATKIVCETVCQVVSIAPLISATLAAAAVVVSIVALVNASKSRRIAQSSLNLSKAADQRQQANYKLEATSVDEQQFSNGDRDIACRLVISNLSDRSSTLDRFSFLVTFEENGRPSREEFSPAAVGAKKVPQLSSPIDVPARGHVSGWVSFHLDKARIDGRTIVRYDLTITDADGFSRTMSDIHPRRTI